MISRPQTVWRFLLAGLCVIGGPVLAAKEAENLLQNMQSAVHKLGYTGKLVFTKGQELAEYQIEHRPGNDSSSESVVRLNQDGSNPVQQSQQFSLINSSGLRLPAKQAYSIDMGGEAQVAGLPCKIVVIRPKDKLRYLHRYCINDEHGMLLKYSVMDRQQQLLEQFMFTQLTIHSDSPNDSAQGMLAVADQQPLVVEPESIDFDVLKSWSFNSLPAGFKVSSINDIPGKSGAYQVILSDGLTYVSVFIESGDPAANGSAQQYPASGATNILSKQVAGHVITLVGEVPLATLQSIHNGLSYVSP